MRFKGNTCSGSVAQVLAMYFKLLIAYLLNTHISEYEEVMNKLSPKLIFVSLFILLSCMATPLMASSADTLTYGETKRPDTLDPYTSREPSSLRLSQLIFNGLVSINERQEIEPDLATSWKISKDKKSFTFQLRKDVKWHTYKKQEKLLTAKDVLHTVKLMQHPKTISPRKEIFNNISKVEILDDHQVKFELKHPAINPIAIFNFKILPHHVLKNSKYLSKSNRFSNHPIGTGPYIFKRSNGNRQITLVANPHYYKGQPKIAKIVAKPFSDKNIMNQALSFNNLDMIVSVSPRHLSELQADARFTLAPYNTLSYSFFAYNQNNPHLSKRLVRKAITHGINREEMLRAFFNNQGTIISGPFAPGSWAYNLDVMPDKYNPLKSISLLKEAGYRQTSKGFMDSNGKFLKFRLRVPIEKNNESTKRVILAYKNFMKKIGISIKVDFMERESWRKAIFKDHKFDITFASWSFDDSSDISTLFHSRFNQKWGNNFISYHNAEVDKLIEQSQKSTDHQEKRTINHKLHQILAYDAPYTFLWSLTEYAAYNKRLSNVKIHPYQFFDDVHLWQKN
ncbi:MAG TPA: hypothetical protein ENJ28_04045 [Gammaproteobacteria bacterium]|nr:hypothetical protein [Gammaproteobacteria bacterium]